jgi:hypothetical protein
MEPLAKPALQAVADGRIRILPDRFEKIYNGWLENIKVRLALTGIPNDKVNQLCSWILKRTMEHLFFAPVATILVSSAE